ncbi:16S rRNA (guanine(527)-N(7))-methyltransferase RsmG [bacterium]|nr:16S rRNA (guanine(527)-N(7))-methyltransferase RsmG [bacterium]
MNSLININTDFSVYKEAFLLENSKHNLISKNDEKYLYEKHIYDSLSFKLFYEKYLQNKNNITLLDIGCGGGFPLLPIAIEFPQISTTGIDSIQKKINSINSIKEKLDIKNLQTICDRVENIKGTKFDVITSRAVADLSKISEYALPLLKSDGFFVAYKSKKSIEEIKSAKKVLQKYKAKVADIIEYSLPLEEVYERNLIIITF